MNESTKLIKDIVRWISYLTRNPKRISHYKLWKNYLGKGNDSLAHNIPWITFSARQELDRILERDNVVFEWGCGGSTLYLSGKVSKVISVEHNKEWYKSVSMAIQRMHIKNVDVHLVEANAKKRGRFLGLYNSHAIPELEFKKYCRFIEKFPDKYFDIVIVDGRSRNSCIYHAVNKVKLGGYILLDNSEREKYRDGVKLLSKWKGSNFFGAGPFNDYFWQTSIFQKIL